MQNRFLAAAVTAVAVMLSVAVVLAGQDQTTDSWTPSTTPWGHPDLQGVWNNTVSTPLERPSRFAGKEFLTDEELADYTAERQGSRDNRDDRDHHQEFDQRKATAQGCGTRHMSCHGLGHCERLQV